MRFQLSGYLHSYETHYCQRIRLNYTIPEHEERPVTTESDCRNRLCVKGIRRRDFLKQIALAGFLAGGSTGQRSTAAPINEPAAASADKPIVPPTITPAPNPAANPAYSAEDFSRMAYCGIRCRAECPENAYPASCEGCKSKGGKLGHYCRICSIRKCAGERQVLTCAHCDGYSSCEADTWKRYPILRRKIDRIRSDLQAQP